MSKPAKSSLITVAPSAVHGLGAFATRPLAAQVVLGDYAGRRYSPEEIASRDWDDRVTYLFSLSSNETIDGAEGGNETRHLNHACEPNCEAFEEYDEEGRLTLRFQTLVAVQKGEELFIDYRLVADADASPDDFPCRCGSENCRGTMLAPGDAS